MRGRRVVLYYDAASSSVIIISRPPYGGLKYLMVSVSPLQRLARTPWGRLNYLACKTPSWEVSSYIHRSASMAALSFATRPLLSILKMCIPAHRRLFVPRLPISRYSMSGFHLPENDASTHRTSIWNERGFGKSNISSWKRHSTDEIFICRFL